jgi:LPXTG-site transpeptidase (sortase) family protein
MQMSTRRRPRSPRALALVVALALLGVTVPAAAPGAIAAVPAGASAYSPITPTRLADTRATEGAYGFTRLGPTHIRVQITGRGNVPAGATAVVLNVASVNGVAPGYVAAFPAGDAIPTTSVLNIDAPRRVIGNMATVRIGTGGAIDLFSNVAMDLVVDVLGSYSPASGSVRSGRLVTFNAGARRVLDTRDRGFPVGGNGTENIDVGRVGVPADAAAVVVNIAATETLPGFWTAFPVGGTRPLAATLNIDAPWQTRNAQAIVQLVPGSRNFSVYAQSGGHLIVDVVGWFTGSSSTTSTDGLFVPTSPLRVLDTRADYQIAPWGGSTIEFGSGSPFPAQTAAVAMNIAATDPLYLGFVTAHPAGVVRPLAANLNITSWDQVIANHGIVRQSNRGLALYTQSGTQLVVDVAGWYTGTPDPAVQPVPVNPSSDPTYAIQVRSSDTPITTGIAYGNNINPIIDRGLAGYWSGSGVLGATGHNVLFAHRTSKGGPFRNLDQLQPGDRFELVGADGRSYVYQVTRTDIIVPTPRVLWDIVMNAGPITATLVACHPPGSIKYRIAVTGRLIGLA